MTATSQSIQIVEYKGHSIRRDFRNPYRAKPEYIFYPTDQGEQHDYDYCDGSFIEMGNCKYADSISDCKKLIDEKVPFMVETVIHCGGFRLKNITKHWDFIEAVQFAVKFNGTMNVSFNSI